MAYSGKYQPKNPKKYKGDTSKIIWRSTYELKMFRYCDFTDNVISWSSEEIIIPYISPLDKRVHRYFMDIYIKYKTPEGIKEQIIEIKPAIYTRPPKKQKRKTKRYIKDVETWIINEAKWNAAEKWAQKRNMKFKIFTERELGIK